jgi:divalent metal cation (Fe/Co/Zn/Cd) transporter
VSVASEGESVAGEATSLAGQEQLHRRAIRLEWFTVSWNVLEAAVAIAAGLAAGSVALIGFGVDSGIEVVAAGALLWRLRTAGAGATDEERGEAERKALYVVAGTFFVLSVYIAVEGVSALASHDEPGTSPLGLGLSIASLITMPILAWAKQQTARRLESRALQADAVETWVCAYLSLALLAGVGLNIAFGWWWADPVGAIAMLPLIVWQ